MMTVKTWAGSVRQQFLVRTPFQRLATLLLIAVELMGMVCIALGHHYLGTMLIGLGVVTIPLFNRWISNSTP